MLGYQVSFMIARRMFRPRAAQHEVQLERPVRWIHIALRIRMWRTRWERALSPRISVHTGSIRGVSYAMFMQPRGSAVPAHDMSEAQGGRGSVGFEREGRSRVIKPRTVSDLLDLREVWAYREVLAFLAWRDVRVRYKQTVVGVIWVVLQPIAMVAVFALFLGHLARVPSDGLPYPLFALAGIIPWQFFARILTASSESMIRDQRLVTKVYFPRVILPTASALAATLDYAISAVLLIGLMAAYGYVPHARTLIAVPLTFILLVFALGVGYWASALNAQFRDVAYAMPFITQVWFFLTPVVYPSSLVPGKFMALYALNPMVGIVSGARWSLLGNGTMPLQEMLIAAAASGVLFISGLAFFRSREDYLADVL